MAALPEALAGSLVLASLYALIGAGFVMVYRSSKVLNFAQGHLALLGAYLFYALSVLLHRDFLWTLAALGVVSVAIGAVLYLVFLSPLAGEGPIILIMITIIIGALIVAIVPMVWGTQPHTLASPLSQAGIHLPGGIVTSELDLVTIATAVVVIAGFWCLIRFTTSGIAMRAAAENPLLASYRGVNVALTAGVSWAFAVFAASVAGTAYGLRATLTPSITGLGFAAFPAVVVGGLDSLPGAMVGAVLLAVGQNLAATYLGGDWTDVTAYLVLLVVLLVRPHGLFGRKELVRV